MKKRMLSLVLALVMAFSLCPLEVFATGGNQWGWGSEAQGPEMPAQQLKAADNESGVSVTVNAPEGALPQGTTLSVKGVSLPAVQTIVDKSADINCTVVAAEDITFYYQGSEIEPEKNVSVTLASDAIANTVNPTVLHLDCSAEEIESGSVPVEVMSVGSDANGVNFSAGDFSVYAILDSQGTGTYTYLTVEFYDADGTTVINKQVVRMDQISQLAAPVHDPGVPSITKTQSFEGWEMTSTPVGEGVATENLDVATINTYIKATYSASSPNTTISYRAMVYDVIYVIYHDQAGAVLKTEAVHKDSSDATVSKAINMAYVPFKSGQNFSGWTPDILVKGDYPTYAAGATVYANGSNANLSSDIRLYPMVKTGHWLAFDNYTSQDLDGTSASYTSPVFYENGTNTAAPATPTRTGYTFDGWFESRTEKQATNSSGEKLYIGLDGELTTETTQVDEKTGEIKTLQPRMIVDTWGPQYTFNANLTADKTVYAKWSPAETTYYVVFWQQSAGDSVGMADADKHYDFYKSEERSATTGQSVQLNLSNSSTNTTADNRLGGNSTSYIGEMGYYFTYNSTNSDTGSYVVEGDGSTVLNVYYDRRTITINFHGSLSSVTYDTYYSSAGSYWWNASYAHYGRVSGKYVLLELGSNYSQYPDEDGEVPTNSGYPKWTVVSTGANYTGTIYEFSGASTSSSGTAITLKGLYDSPLTGWPLPGTGYQWHSTSGSYSSNYGMTLPVYSFKIWGTNGTNYTDTTWDIWRETDSPSDPKSVIYLGQDTDGDYTIPLATYQLGYGHTLTIDHTLFYGYTMHEYRFGTSGSWTNLDDASNHTFNYDNTTNNFGSNASVTIHYKRNTWDFIYSSNNHDVKTESVFFQKSLSDLAGYVPTNGPRGYYFDGWYADPGFDTPFNFNQNMPNHPVKIYAKWTLTRFRVVLLPNGGNNDLTITFPGGTQATTFRVDYGELVQASSINNAQRPGYTLLGWYLDEACTIPFNFANPVTNEIAVMGYNELPDAQRRGTDPWNGNKAYDDADGEHEDVRGKVTIYAKWRADPEGTIGIHVEYDAMDGKVNVTGTPQTWDDPYIYADQAEAFGQPASVPNNNKLQFLYWEIMRPTSETDPTLVSTGKKVYPGKLWDVLVEDAVKTTGDSTGSTANATRSTGNANPVKATTTYELLTSAPSDWSGNYVITYGNSSTSMYVLKGVTPSSNGAQIESTSNAASYANSGVTLSGTTLSNVSNDYVFTLTANGSYYAIKSLSTGAYYGMNSSSEISGYTNYNSTYCDWTPNYNVSNSSQFQLKNKANGSYPYFGWSTSNKYFWGASTSNANVLYLWKATTTSSTNYTVTAAVNNSSYGTAAVSGSATVTAGGTVTINASPNSGYTYASPAYTVTSGTATVTQSGNTFTVTPSSDCTVQINFQASGGSSGGGSVTREYWEPTTTIVPGEEYLIGMEIDGDIYLAVNYNVFAESSYVWFTSGSEQSNGYYPYNYFMGYLAEATLDEDNVVAVNTANIATDLQYCTWKFSTATGGTITSGYDSSTYLAYGSASNSTYNYTLYITAPYSQSTTWTYSDGHLVSGSWYMTSYTQDSVNYLEYATDASDAATIHLYHKVVVEEQSNYTVTFKDHDGTVLSEQTVTAGGNAVPPEDPAAYEEGGKTYTFVGWDTSYVDIHADTVVTAVYVESSGSSTETTRYTIYLHAVYDRANTDAKTHITWYGNNDPTGETSGVTTQRDEGVELNVGYAIPRPEAFVNGTVNRSSGSKAGEETVELTYYKKDGENFVADENYEFLGWARLDAPEGDVSGSAHPELGEDDLYLKWDPTMTLTVNGETVTGGYQFKSNGTWVAAQNVAADEMTPYHDMYAVWGKVFYVYHSGTGKVERIVIDSTLYDKKDDGTGKMVDDLTKPNKNTFDLTELVSPGFLYGGYYKDYAGKSSGFDATTATGWTDVTSVSSIKTDATLTSVTTNADLTTLVNNKRISQITDSGARTYTYSEGADNIAAIDWDRAKAYNSSNEGVRAGNAMIPEAGATYFIKEVPADMYLRHYTHFTYKYNSALITKLFLISDIDDGNYSQTGFVITRTSNKATYVTTSLTVTSSNTGLSMTLTPNNVFGSKHVTKGYLTCAIFNPNTVGTNNVRNYWLTLDGVLVTGACQRNLLNVTNAQQIQIGTLEDIPSTINAYQPVASN